MSKKNNDSKEKCNCKEHDHKCSGSHGDPKQDLQSKYGEYQIVAQQLDQVQKQMQIMDNQLNEVTFIVESLGDFEKLKVGSEILVPISNGIFAKAELKDNEKLLVNIGSEAVAQKTVAETVDMLNIQLTEINNYKEQIGVALEQLNAQAEKLKKEIQSISI